MPADDSITSGIYCIRCLPTGKVYVGSAVDLTKRRYRHRTALNTGKHHCVLLQRAWRKYGSESFRWEVIERVEPARLIEREQYYIETMNATGRATGFNLCPKAGSILGVKRSAETIAKMSAAQTGRKQSPEQVARFSARMKGRIISAEARAKQSAALKGKPLSPEHRAKIAAANTGKKHSAETKAKLSMIVRNCSAETIAKRVATRRANRLRKARESGRPTQGLLFE